MGKLLKWLFGIVIFLVVLVVAAVIVLPMVIDPNDHKDEIVKAVKDKTGRDFGITEQLELTVFPWLGIETGGVSLGNAAGFGEQPFAKVEELGVRVKVLPLLSKRIEIDTLVLNGLALNLEKNKDGKTNWDDLAGAQKDEQKEADQQGQEASGPGFAFQVQGIQIERGDIRWRDRQAGQDVSLKGVRLVTGALTPGATVPVEAGVIITSEAPQLSLTAELSGSVETNADLDRFTIADLLVKLDASGEGLPKEGLAVRLATAIKADLGNDTLNINDLDVTGNRVALKGNLAVARMQTKPEVNGKIQLQQTDLKALAAMFGTVIETAEPSALTKVSADVTLAQAGKMLKLDPLKVVLDQSTLTGFVHLLNSEGPIVRSKLRLDQINLDHYMPPPAAGEAAQAQPPAEKTGGGADPFAALRTLDLEAELAIAQLVISNAKMQDVSARVVSRNGVLDVAPINAKLYEGKFDGSVQLNAKSKTPKIHAVKHLTGIQVGPLLLDVAGQDKLTGKGAIHADIRLTGLDQRAIKRTLNGNASFNFADGAFKGVNLSQLLRSGQGGGADARTDFSALGASMTIENGVIRSDDLNAQSPLLRIEKGKSKGTVNLPENTIDYLLTGELVASLEGQGGKGADQLTGVAIPVRITGDLAAPKFRPDLEAALSAKAKKQLDAKKDEIGKKIEEKAGKQFGDALKGIFGR